MSAALCVDLQEMSSLQSSTYFCFESLISKTCRPKTYYRTPQKLKVNKSILCAVSKKQKCLLLLMS